MLSVRLPRLVGSLVVCAGLLALASCEDPSGVGLTVIDFGETDPRARTVPAEAAVDSLVDVTGFIRPPTGDFLQRTLAGRAHDPLLGTVEATGYIDFARQVVDQNFFFVPFEGVFLDLVPDYVYGDSTGTATIDILEVAEAWEPLAFTSDSVLTVHQEIVTTFTVAARDTLVRITMPEKWVSERDSLLRAENFEQLFHGFQLRPRPESELVVGFSGNSTLNVLADFLVVTDIDTVTYFAIHLASGVTRDDKTAPPPPAELFPIQDNVGLGLTLEFRLDTLDSPVMSTGFVRIEADTLLLEAFRPANFVRPIARRLSLFGMDNGSPVLLAEAPLDEAAEAFIFSSPLLNHALQEMVLGRGRFDQFAVGFPRSPATLNAAPLVTRPDAPPRAVILVVPAGQ